VEEIRNEKLMAELKEDMMDYMRMQTTEINNLRKKVYKIDDEMEGYLKERDGESSESEKSGDYRDDDADSQKSRDMRHHASNKSFAEDL